MSRPSFPAKLSATTTALKFALKTTQNTPKNIAIRPAFPWAVDTKGIKNAAQAPAAAASLDIGLASGAVRNRMVDKLAAQGISDAALLHAMRTVERHRFVDTALVGQAYEDTSLPIGLGQTISKPNVVARMIELLRRGAALSGSAPLQAGRVPEAGRVLDAGRVLEIGTGCGYQAAVLAQLYSEVYSIERLRGLHDKARENLRPYKIAHLHLLLGDGMLGYAQGAPYVGIIAAAGGASIPPAWIAQLALGGRIVAPMVTAAGAQALVVVDKTQQGVTQTVLEAVHFVPLKSGVM